jgi:hypothetical protein
MQVAFPTLGNETGMMRGIHRDFTIFEIFPAGISLAPFSSETSNGCLLLWKEESPT